MNMHKPTVFIYGLLAALAAVIAETIFAIFAFPQTDSYALGSFPAMLAAAVIEEFFLGTTIWKIARAAENRRQGFLQAILLSTGFTFLEILLNLFKLNNFDRASAYSFVGLWLVHSTTAALMAHFFYGRPKKVLAIASVFAGAVALHLLYIVSVLFELNAVWKLAPAVIIFLSLYFFSFRTEKPCQSDAIKL